MTRTEVAIESRHGFTICEVTDTGPSGETTAQSYLVRCPDGTARPFIFLEVANAYVDGLAASRTVST
jgi:hypothetical protein